MKPVLVVVTSAVTTPAARLLLEEMTVEVSELYGTPPGRNSLDARSFRPPAGRFLIGQVEDEPVACVAYRRIEDGLAEVHRVYVRPRSRGRGIGRMMLERAEALATEAGYQRLRLETGVRQPQAIAIYESLGYTPIPRFAPYEDDLTSLCYAKRIG